MDACWLMKAEPDSRIVKGKDVKFSVDDFENEDVTPWEGVRNAEARNLMKEMKIGDKILFYHSNCKNPGIAAFAEVAKEAYPDHTAWDEAHPYFDAKTDKEKPKWFMIDAKFKCRTPHFVSLALLKQIATSSSDDIPYLNSEDVNAIKGMALISRGRLSVQRVRQEEWDTISKLAEKGGWDETKGRASKKEKRDSSSGEVAIKDKLKLGKRKVEDDDDKPKRRSARRK